MTEAALKTADPRQAFCGTFAKSCRPRKVLTVSQWADAHRVLTPESSSEPGPWRTSRIPYLREIMDALSVRSAVKTITIMKSSQGGGTEIGLNWIGYVMDHAPGPMLVVVPTLQVRTRWVRQRLDPMLTGTPRLAGKLDIRRRRDGSNTEELKIFPGGLLVLGGANSPASLAAMPIRYVLNDEVDRFPWQSGVEGDPMGLISERQKTFARRKTLNISSPTVTGASRIEELYEASDQRRYHVPCPDCQALMLLEWKNLRWDREVKRAWYVCVECGSEIDEHHKTRMLERGRWIAAHPEREARGYHWNGLYSPIGLGHSWLELAREFLAVHKDPVKFKRFVNTVLGETFEERSHDVQPNKLLERREDYRLREIPPGCLILTCGVDVQADRFAIQAVGWGRREVSWLIDWLELPADPSRIESWEKLAEVLNRPFTNAFGRPMHILATAIDTGGHYTHEAYAFVRSGAAPRLMAIKGANTPNQPILGRPRLMDIHLSGRTIKRGVKLWMVGTDTAKHSIYGRLHGDGAEGVKPEDRMMHFPVDAEAEYFDQLASEVYDSTRNRWVKRRGKRNEGIDTRVYAYAAACHPEIRVHRMRLWEWDELAAKLESEPEDKTDEQIKPPAQQPVRQRHTGLGSEDWNL